MKTSTDNQHPVRLDNVTRTFGFNGRHTAAVQEISLEARPGQLLLLLGPSGSGKTTLLTMMAGLLSPSSGSVRLFGKPVERYSARERQVCRARKIGFVFQTFHLIDSLTVLDNVVLVLRFAGVSRRKARAKAMRLLGQFEIEHLATRLPGRLSQGEKQRVAVARAVANDAELIIADEPTASLETKQGLDIIRLLHHYATAENKCVIVASHDLRIVPYADRVVRLEDGRLVENGEKAGAA